MTRASPAESEQEVFAVELLLFAQAADIAGVRRVPLRVGTGITVGQCWALLDEQQPTIAAALEPLRGRMAMALNDRYARPAEVLRAGDVLAFIPPVSGG